MQEVVDEWNSQVTQRNKSTEKYNAELANEVKKGKLKLEDALKFKRRYVNKCRCGKVSRQKVWAFTRRFKWVRGRFNIPSGSLPFKHPRNVKWHEAFRRTRERLKVPPQLILNVDQVARMKYRGHSWAYKKSQNAKTGQAAAGGQIAEPRNQLVKRRRLTKKTREYLGFEADDHDDADADSEWMPSVKENLYQLIYIYIYIYMTLCHTPW